MKIVRIILTLLIASTFVLGQKSMTFQQATEMGIYQKLDSFYSPGIDSDSLKSVFKDKNAYIEAYQQFIFELSNFLSKNNFKWGKQVRCFNKIYFSEKGTVNYFLYNFKKGEITSEQEIQFGGLVKQFIQHAKFSLPTNKQFAQCSPVKYNDK